LLPLRSGDPVYPKPVELSPWLLLLGSSTVPSVVEDTVAVVEVATSLREVVPPKTAVVEVASPVKTAVPVLEPVLKSVLVLVPETTTTPVVEGLP